MSDKPNYDMTGILFHKEEKKSDRAPDWTGTITIEGKEWELAAWDRSGNKGAFKTLKVSEKRRQDVSSTVPARQPQREPMRSGKAPQMQPEDDFYNDPVPF